MMCSCWALALEITRLPLRLSSRGPQSVTKRNLGVTFRDMGIKLATKGYTGRRHERNTTTRDGGSRR